MKILNDIFNIKSDYDFDKIALDIFQFQAKNNIIYKEYIKLIGKNPQKITSISDVPFLPITFFKTKKVTVSNIPECNNNPIIFKSSGTSEGVRSQHFVNDKNIYIKSFLNGFKTFFGNPEQYTILALLPSYIETGDSSLVYMVDTLINISNSKHSGFFLHNYSELSKKLQILKNNSKKTILFGVTYALLDAIEYINEKYPELIIIETGGMKGRKKELTRQEIHNKLKQKFGVEKIYSEYGMTELLSQAYSTGNGLFKPTKTMKIIIRDIYDPFECNIKNKTGGINIIDLANIFSCSFIETKDLGKEKNNEFEILGRFDNTDIRGCNLLIT